jgi:hypothetical protein
LRIGFDLDGTLADMESELVRQAKLLFGDTMTERLGAQPPNPGATHTALDAAEQQAAAENAKDNVPPLLKLDMTPRQQRKLWRHVESIDNFWFTLREIEPGAVKRLAEVSAEYRWEVIFLTKRPETIGKTAQMQTQRWLEAKGFTLPSVFVVQKSRGRIADALGLDIVVDDRPENCLDVVVDSKARAILVWREGAEKLPANARRLGIGVVKSVGECLDILTQVDSTTREQQPGMMARVMRLLGLKEPAASA